MSFSIPIPALYTSVTGRLELPSAGDYELDLPEFDLPVIQLEVAEPVAQPDQPDYTTDTVPAFGVMAENAKAASYTAATEVIAFINPDMAVTPTYSTAPLVPSLVYQAATGAPTQYPEAGLISIPDSAGLVTQLAPSISVGDRPAMLEILTRGFIEADVDLFNAAVPVTGAVDATPLDDALPLVLSRNDDALVAKLTEVMAGSPALDLLTRELMYQQANEVITDSEIVAEQQIMGESAARGFSLPNGAATAKMLEMTKKSAYTRLEAAEAVRDETYKITRAQVDTAIAKAMALELKHSSVQLKYYAQLLETQKYNIKLHVTLFDSIAALFNAKVKVLNIQVSAYSAYIRAVLEQYAGHNAELGAINAKVMTFKAETDAYSAQVSTIESIARINTLKVEDALLAVKEYEAYIGAVDNNIKMIKLNLEAYRTAVGAYSKSIDTDVAYVSAYADYVGAESAKIQVTEANIQSYSSFWSAERARAGAYENWANAASSVINAEMAEYKDYAAAQRSYIATMSDKVNASVRALSTYLSSMDTVSSYTSSYNRAFAAWSAFDMSVQLNNAEVQLTQDTLRTSAQADETRLEAGRLGATVTIMAGLAQAAYSVIGTSVSINANASAGTSASENNSLGYNGSLSRSYSHSRSKSLSR
jgi:hypothetical protein